jgi:hypothetical protein
MSWKYDGAVERGTISTPHKDLAGGAGEMTPLPHNGFFEPRPHRAA